jgi:hypothetical protein
VKYLGIDCIGNNPFNGCGLCKNLAACQYQDKAEK